MSLLPAANLMLPVAGAYAVAALAAWLFATTRAHGVIYAPGKLLRVYRPVLIAILAGFVPAAILAALLVPRYAERAGLALLIFAAGLAVTGGLTHRDLLRKVGRAGPWNTVLVAVTLVAALASAWLFFAANR